MATLVIGYNVEWTKGASVTSQFLKQARKVHEGDDAPCTLYLRGDVIEQHRSELKSLAANPLFDLQMTLSKPMKTVCQVAEGQTTIWRGGTREEIEEELRKTTALFQEAFERRPTGISSPLGYYRGLQDRPDILEILDRHGIRFTRTYARDQHDWQPVDFSVEPFTYLFQGFPHIVEFPSQGWQEAIIRKMYGWDDTQSYLEFVRTDADEAAQRDELVWSYWAHDWSVMQGAPDMPHIAVLLRYAEELGIEIMTQHEAYKTFLKREETAHSVDGGQKKFHAKAHGRKERKAF